jgi:hypothetical protein
LRITGKAGVNERPRQKTLRGKFARLPAGEARNVQSTIDNRKSAIGD